MYGQKSEDYTRSTRSAKHLSHGYGHSRAHRHNSRLSHSHGHSHPGTSPTAATTNTDRTGSRGDHDNRGTGDNKDHLHSLVPTILQGPGQGSQAQGQVQQGYARVHSIHSQSQSQGHPHSSNHLNPHPQSLPIHHPPHLLQQQHHYPLTNIPTIPINLLSSNNNPYHTSTSNSPTLSPNRPLSPSPSSASHTPNTPNMSHVPSPPPELYLSPAATDTSSWDSSPRLASVWGPLEAAVPIGRGTGIRRNPVSAGSNSSDSSPRHVFAWSLEQEGSWEVDHTLYQFGDWTSPTVSPRSFGRMTSISSSSPISPNVSPRVVRLPNQASMPYPAPSSPSISPSPTPPTPPAPSTPALTSVSGSISTSPGHPSIPSSLSSPTISYTSLSSGFSISSSTSPLVARKRRSSPVAEEPTGISSCLPNIPQTQLQPPYSQQQLQQQGAFSIGNIVIPPSPADPASGSGSSRNRSHSTPAPQQSSLHPHYSPMSPISPRQYSQIMNNSNYNHHNNHSHSPRHSQSQSPPPTPPSTPTTTPTATPKNGRETSYPDDPERGRERVTNASYEDYRDHRYENAQYHEAARFHEEDAIEMDAYGPSITDDSSDSQPPKLSKSKSASNRNKKQKQKQHISYFPSPPIDEEEEVEGKEDESNKMAILRSDRTPSATGTVPPNGVLTSVPGANASGPKKARNKKAVPPANQLPVPTSAVLPTATPVCRYFMSGYCSRGTKCIYLHPIPRMYTKSPHPSVPVPLPLSLALPVSAPIPNFSQNTKPVATRKGQSAKANNVSPKNHSDGQNKSGKISEGGSTDNATVDKDGENGVVSGTSPFLSSGSEGVSLEDCVGKIKEMCMDQTSCRYLQKLLEKNEQNTVDMIFVEVVEDIVTLMRDPFGNYLCQRLIDKCTQDQKTKMIKGAARDLVFIAKNMHGTRAVQKVIDSITMPEEIKAVKNALKGSVVTLIEDLNGNHVIQKCLRKFEPKDNQFIYDAVAKHCIQVSTHRHGCCVLQRCIDHGTPTQRLQLVNQIELHSLSLVQDAFGNYVVQYILDLNVPDLPTKIVKRLEGKVKDMSKQKFSSNVVEKCLKVGNGECVARIICEIIDVSYNSELPILPNPIERELAQKRIAELIHDSYGNYVIQTCLGEGGKKARKEYQAMVEVLLPSLRELKTIPYSRRIEELLRLVSIDDPNPNSSS